MTSKQRPYDLIADALRAHVRERMTLQERMRLVADTLWRELAAPDGPVSWVGFYLPAEDGQSLVLGPMRNKPACSPIGLHGVCGRGYLTRRAVLVEDTRALGDDYVACDPRDRSEVVLPILDDAGNVMAVLDVDSHQVAAFDWTDVAGLAGVLTAAGLQAGG